MSVEKDVPDKTLDMSAFYENIVALTEETAEKSVLSKHTDALYDLLMDSYIENIKIAAGNGYSTAYLALFNNNTAYRGNALIVDLLFPSEKVIKKCAKHGIVPIFDRIKSTLQPFEVEYKVLNEDDDIKNQISGIIAHWKSPQDDSSDSEGESALDENADTPGAETPPNRDDNSFTNVTDEFE
jgi:hypothetical protein